MFNQNDNSSKALGWIGMNVSKRKMWLNERSTFSNRKMWISDAAFSFTVTLLPKQKIEVSIQEVHNGKPLFDNFQTSSSGTCFCCVCVFFSLLLLKHQSSYVIRYCCSNSNQNKPFTKMKSFYRGLFGGMRKDTDNSNAWKKK